MSTYAQIGDFKTRTIFEIRKELLPDNVVAILELTCECKDQVPFETFVEEMNNIFNEGLKVEKARSLYNYIVHYAVEPQLIRVDGHLEYMQYETYVEVGTLYDNGLMDIVHCPKNSYYFELKHGDIRKNDRRQLQLRWHRMPFAGQEKYIPGFLLPDTMHFCPLAHIATDKLAKPVVRVNHKDLHDEWLDSFAEESV